ncbi:sugar transporter ERD6-like 5 isoform X3 [Arabidopsis lyrata subsp. lyrata]|uniref:sugar transporter ERD6-like 5 isoform X3 n=1 Tax=Arabidopsis lyrata subsp. lyrata TaxID=81972 RepID=UPI000A29A31A|nr:sugar transporter ERD6-like 5 isoform X3 [Arabidopsis lyrata subsp. lyrata]|eukprot:XP_020868547.1 sugar transporter ERD6-like 5 isoform X3 [Arabidopsis lyrata subsp. lyrata]
MKGEIDEANLAPETSLIEKENQDSSATTTTTLLLTTFVAVSGSFVFGSAIGYSSPVQSDLTKDLNLSVAEYSLFGSILTIGAMIGAAMSGRIADLIGRRATMGFSEMFCILGWLTIYLSKVAVWLDVGRFLVGYGMGVLSFVVPVYIAEITPKDLRGGFTTVHQLMICLGVSVAYLLGSFIGWRILALIGLVPCVIQMMGLFIIPESPRWLAKVGRWEEFEIALQRLRGESADISYESNEIKDYTQRLTNLSEGSILDLFQPKYAKSLFVGVGLMVLQQFGGVNGIAFYSSSIFESAGFSSKIGMIAMVVVQIPMTTLGVVLMDKSGRRPLLLFVKLLSGDASYLALAGVLVYTGSFSLGMGGIPWVIMSEIFPIDIKGPAGSLVTVVSWVGSWIISFTFNFLMNWNPAGTFYVFASVCGATVIFVAKLVPETIGRTLEEIQYSIGYVEL